MKIRRELIHLLFAGLVTFLVVSCLNDHSEEYQADHDAAFEALKQHYGITEDENIGDNIYVHFTYLPVNGYDAMMPEADNYIVLDYVGLYSNLDAFDVTRKEDAEEYELYRSDVVYGPIRLDVNQTFLGFYKGIQHIPEGAEAVILIPHEQAFLNYEPIVYEVALHRIIDDLAGYDSIQLVAYMDSFEFAFESMTFEDSPTAYYKTTVEGDSIIELETGDSVTVCLYGHYVEADPAYVDSFPGRQFFPINESGDIVKFALDDVIFPITEIVNISVHEMKMGETREVLSPSEYTYGETGFIHPYIGVYIVPPSIPIHYTITLVDYEKMEFRK